jgi:hypothetical protein
VKPTGFLRFLRTAFAKPAYLRELTVADSGAKAKLAKNAASEVCASTRASEDTGQRRHSRRCYQR